NPMTTEQEYLRVSLRANLLTALAENLKHEEGGIRLFELGRIYIPRTEDLPDEREVLCGLLCRPETEVSWHGGGEPPDFFAAKGVVEGLLGYLGVVAGFQKSSDGGLHPNKQAAVVVEGVNIGVIGELHPQVLSGFENAEPAYIFEINLPSLLPFTAGYEVFQPVPRFPPTVRDIALVLPDNIAHGDVIEVIRGFPLVKKVTLFDVYTGERIPPGTKSLAYRIVYQSPTHTLTDAEVNGVQQQVLDRLSHDLGATLRS
ncbi:MAG: phenylalanine--tRNA ligase subunit beta, partial [Dehalococcoidales bacterium]